MNNSKLTDLEEKFCWIYACGPSPYIGNAEKTFELVFNQRTGQFFTSNEDELALEIFEEANTTILAHRFMLRNDIKDRIEEIKRDTAVDAASLRPRLTGTLLKISDECSTLHVTDRFGNTVSPAPLRSVAVNAIAKLINMYGIKEDIAHKVMLEGADGDGITFNLILPQQNKENELSDMIE